MLSFHFSAHPLPLFDRVTLSMPLMAAMWSSRSQPDPLGYMLIPTTGDQVCHWFITFSLVHIGVNLDPLSLYKYAKVYAGKGSETIYIVKDSKVIRRKVSYIKYAFFYHPRIYLRRDLKKKESQTNIKGLISGRLQFMSCTL